MFDFKTIFAIISVLIVIFSYALYFKDIFSGKTKPHAYSWLVWSTVSGIAFFGQLVGQAGSGAWVTGANALITFFIFIYAYFKSERDITKSDKISLTAAFFTLILFLIFRSDPLIAVILTTIIATIGFYPTIRKSYFKPEQETLFTFFLSGSKYIFGFLALQNYSIITWLYPLSQLIVNYGFVLMLLIRRKYYKTRKLID